METRNEDIARLTKNQEQFWVNNHAHILRSNENSDIRYIKYFLNKSDLSGYITGSAQPKLNKANLNSIRMVLPPLEEQKAIAHILSTLDDKIEVNNQINRTLENMAQTIFKQWFVDFEFPNEDGEPYKSSGGEMVESELGMIPKGWEVVQIDSLCRHIKPGTNYQPKRIDLGIPFLNVRNINKGHIDVTDVKYISKEDFENVHKSWVPEENDVLISRIGTLGLVAVIRKRDLPIAVHYNFINFKTKDVSFQFFYFTLKSDFFQSQYHGIKKASVQEYVTLDEVKKLKLVFPTNREIFKNFEKKFIDMYELINNKQEETESLIKIRDSLLPKLMSGEIRVPLNEEGDVS
ncbi:hypothetical protein RV16_GL001286 [Enterococcus saccharolyticus]|nr:hypothetical protein RV16_GL001286 [Enterococcus saccharolyticus]